MLRDDPKAAEAKRIRAQITNKFQSESWKYPCIAQISMRKTGAKNATSSKLHSSKIDLTENCKLYFWIAILGDILKVKPAILVIKLFTKIIGKR